MARKFIVFTIVIVFILICLFSANLIEKNKKFEGTFIAQNSTSSDVEEDPNVLDEEKDSEFGKNRENITSKEFFQIYMENIDSSKYKDDFNTFELISFTFLAFSRIKYWELEEVYDFFYDEYNLDALPLFKVTDDIESSDALILYDRSCNASKWTELRHNFIFFLYIYINSKFISVRFHFSLRNLCVSLQTLHKMNWMKNVKI